jgi:hypothetical protein
MVIVEETLTNTEKYLLQLTRIAYEVTRDVDKIQNNYSSIWHVWKQKWATEAWGSDAAETPSSSSRSATQEFPKIIWNPQSSLLFSQEPSASPYPQRDESSPYRPTLFL